MPPEPKPHRNSPAKESEWSICIATLAGIPIRLHFTFLILLSWIALSGNREGGAPPLLRALFVICLFGCVLLHELGHAVVAKRYGIQTHDITLTPIGGIASLEKAPLPRQELWIALAGPLVNVALSLLLFLGARLAGEPFALSQKMPAPNTLHDFLGDLLQANIVLALFNLLPVFPMDGGRVLRSLLARVTSDLAATQIAVKIGQFAAVLLGVFAFLGGHWMLVILALFVYMAGGQEAKSFQMHALATGRCVREAMMREFHTLTPGNNLRQAADALLAGAQHDFPVVNGDEPVGVLSRNALMRYWASEGPDVYVSEAMDREFLKLPAEMPLEEALAQIQEKQGVSVLVMEPNPPYGERLVGMLTQENLMEFLILTQLQNARGAAPRR